MVDFPLTQLKFSESYLIFNTTEEVGEIGNGTVLYAVYKNVE